MCVLNMNASDTRRDIMEKVNVSYTKLREGARESGLTKLPVHKPVELMKTKDDQVNLFSQWEIHLKCWIAIVHEWPSAARIHGNHLCLRFANGTRGN